MQEPWGAGPYVYSGVNDERRGRGSGDSQSQGQRFTRLFARTSEISDQRRYLHSILEEHHCDELHFSGGAALDPAITPDQSLRSQELFNPRIHEIAFNLDRDFLKSRNVRAALSCYLDRKTLAKNLFGDVNLVNGPIPYGYNSYCDTCIIAFQDSMPKPAMADSLLKAAGYHKDLVSGRWMKDGKTLKIKLLGWTGEAGSRIASIVDNIVSGWKQVGIDASFEVKSQAEYRDRSDSASSTRPFMICSTMSFQNWTGISGKGGDKNFQGYQDDSVNVLWTKFMSCSEAEILPTWMALHKRVADQVPCAFLWSPRIYAAYPSWMGIGQQWYPNNFLGRVEYWKVSQ